MHKTELSVWVFINSSFSVLQKYSINSEDCDIAPLRNCFLTLVCYFETILKIDTFVSGGFVTLGPCPLSEEHNCYIKYI